MNWFKILIVAEIIIAITSLCVALFMGNALIFNLCCLIICVTNLCGTIYYNLQEGENNDKFINKNNNVPYGRRLRFAM